MKLNCMEECLGSLLLQYYYLRFSLRQRFPIVPTVLIFPLNPPKNPKLKDLVYEVVYTGVTDNPLGSMVSEGVDLDELQKVIEWHFIKALAQHSKLTEFYGTEDPAKAIKVVRMGITT